MQLTFNRVTKFYGPVIGVNGVTCSIGSGITALFGANGAGKSTMMKLASGQLRPSLGEVRVGPYSAWSPKSKRILGYSPDLNRFYEDMTGREFVVTMARLHGFSRRDARERTDQALEQVGMADRAGRRLAGCSHGMRQRIKLAQALVHDPAILLLDEPMAAIDPGGRRELSLLFQQLAEGGKAILISTHILVEVEDLADSILVIARGRILASGSLGEIRGLLDDRPFGVEIIAEPARRLASLLVESHQVRSVEVRDERLLVQTRRPVEFFAMLGDLVMRNSIEVRQMQTMDTGAEAVFGYLQQGAS